MEGTATYEVVLLPTFEQAESWRKARAREGGLFGATVTTFRAWIADLWELCGDGRVLVDPLRREAVMRIAFAQMPAGGKEDEDAPALSPGIAPMAARCESRAAGIAAFDAAVEAAGAGQVPDGLLAREAWFLRGIARYRELIATLDLVEGGEACAWLARHAAEVFPHPVRVLLEDAAPLDWQAGRFFSACPQLQVELHGALGAEGVRRLPDGVAPRFAFPAGRYAEAALVADIIRDAEGATVVCAPNPLTLYRQLEPALADAGIACAVQARERFGATDFGRAFLLMNRLLQEDGWDTAALADVLHTPFSGLSPAQARAFDVRLRGDRLARREPCLSELRQRFDGFAACEGLASPDAATLQAALDQAEHLVHAAPGRSPAWQACQLSAIAAVRAVVPATLRLGAGAEDALAVLEHVALAVSCASVPAHAHEGAAGIARVLVTTQAQAAQRPPLSCDTLVATGLTSQAYPLADKDDAGSTLLAKLGLRPADDALSQARRTFRALQQLPARSFVCMRPLNDAEGNPAYPCAMVEEFIDAYRNPVNDAAGAYGLPVPLAQDARERGEELLYANAMAASGASVQPLARRVVLPPLGTLTEACRPAALPQRVPGQGVPPRGPSPSQVELYLECPYKWFLQRRLGAQDLEEGFGAKERGTFAHAVLERFYRAFGRKVTPDNLNQAKELLRATAQAVQAQMRQAEPGGSRLVATSRLEARELAQFKAQLEDYLDFEAQLLPGFAPAHLEYRFGGAQAACYAGCSITGTVDRIDVDGNGRAVVIDYKGSLDDEHNIAGKHAGHPGKIQTRMYAQIVRRELGLEVVGALYASYGKRHALAGAVDARALESAHLPYARELALWCVPGGKAPAGCDDAQPVPYAGLSFTQMLDATEELVASAYERMQEGDIAPRPSSPAACAWCPVADCPKRGV